MYIISGRQSWGIAFYINNKLIPEIELRRGETYTFRVEGGSDPSKPAQYHPLYITNDPVGGYMQKLTTADKAVSIFPLSNLSQSFFMKQR